jgi:uncharacterized protein (DUF1330 family)
MAKGYIVVTYRKITSQEKWQAYAKLAAPAIQKSGGRFIVRGMPSAIHEMGLKERVVIVEFDNVHKAMAAHDTADYKKALDALGDGAERDFRIVEGV